MQRPDEKKRQLIIATAARLFAAKPFHKVRLDDIAAAAKIGKGTLYVYFDNKEDLYFSLIYDGFANLVGRLKRQLKQAQSCAAEDLRLIVGELVGFAHRHPHFFQLMRAVGTSKVRSPANWEHLREELQALIEAAIRRGVKRGELADSNPRLTAMCIPGMVRSVMMYGPKTVDEAGIAAHLSGLLERAIAKRGKR
jgi:AcrR family transcriptional regulator